MRRVLLLAAFTLVLGLAVTPRVRGSVAEGTPVPLANHPLVGSWDVELNWSDSAMPSPVLVTFAADGTVIATDAQGLTWHGAWVATGPRSADYTYVSLGTAGDGSDAATFIGQAEVEASGNTFVRSTKLTGGMEVHGERISAR